jgi:hypothetical protein
VCGISKITTEAECKAAAKFNRENHIDRVNGYLGPENFGYGYGAYPDLSRQPRGCIKVNGHYTFNGVATKVETNINRKCSKYGDGACICKPNTCITCPINTFSEGGIYPTCTPCPKDRPTTNFTIRQATCIPVPKIKCKPGYKFTIGDGITRKKECTMCKVNTYSPGGVEVKCSPCPDNRPTTNGRSGQSECKACEPGYGIVGVKKTDGYKCQSCKEKTIRGKKTASPGGLEECTVCPSGTEPNTDHSRCVDQRFEAALNQFEKRLVAQKEETNDLSIKNSRLWAKEQIRLQHDKIMHERKNKDNENENDFCKRESKKGTIIFPAIEITNEIEKIEDTTCIDTNRDELLKSFCSFTSDLDNLFQIQRMPQQAKSFWPNICCKVRNDKDISKTLETCDPPEGSNIKREDIIPFA